MLPRRISITSTMTEGYQLLSRQWTGNPYTIRPSLQRSLQSSLSKEVHASVFYPSMQTLYMNLRSSNVEPPCSIEDIPEIDAVMISVRIIWSISTTYRLTHHSRRQAQSLRSVRSHSSPNLLFFWTITVSIHTLSKMLLQRSERIPHFFAPLGKWSVLSELRRTGL